MKAKEKTQDQMVIERPPMRRIRVCVLGLTPMIFNSVSYKAMCDLLLPPRKKNQTERESTLKHDPRAEYGASVYRFRNDDHATRLYAPVGSFKKSMMAAALRIPGATKTEIGQLLWIDEFNVPIYGVPQLKMDVVRMKDIGRTPDIRTRAILPRWASYLSVNYVSYSLTDQSLMNLLSAAGLLSGIGDGRQEKGTHAFGQFEIVNEDNETFQSIVKHEGRKAQDAGLADPAMFDDQTERLLAYYDQELARRKNPPQEKEKASKKRGNGAARNVEIQTEA